MSHTLYRGFWGVWGRFACVLGWFCWVQALVWVPEIVAAQTYLKASNPDAGDGFGTAVAAAGDWVAVSAIGESSNAQGVDGNQTNNGAPLAGAVYIFIKTNGVWVQEAYLKAGNTGLTDRFGTSLAMSGNTLVVGAPFEDSYPDPKNSDPVNNDGMTDSGAAYVFTRINGVWVQEAMLKGGHDLLGWTRSRGFGTSVAIDGDTIVVGCPRELESTTGINPPRDAFVFGPYSVGAAYVYRRQGTQWVEVAFIKPPYASQDADLQFGRGVAVAGKNVFVSTVRDASTAQGINGTMTQEPGGVSGAVCAYRLEGGVLTFDAYLKSSNSDAGDAFGWSISAAGERLAVSAIQEDSDGSGINGGDGNSSAKAGSGAVYLFERGAAGWQQVLYIKAPQTAANDNFGLGVALKGSALAISSNSQVVGPEGSSRYPGTVYLYVWSDGVWQYEGIYKPSKKGGASENFGWALAFSDHDLVVGASADDNAGVGVGSAVTGSRLNSGAAYLYGGVPGVGINPVKLQWVGGVPPEVTLQFNADPGLSSFHFWGGTRPESLTTDLSGQAVVEEMGEGQYRARLVVPAVLNGGYFIRLGP